MPHHHKIPKGQHAKVYHNNNYTLSGSQPIGRDVYGRARGSDLRCHYKNTYEVVSSIKGLTVAKAEKYLNRVLEHQACIPFRRHTGGVGRTAQAKVFGATQGRWPEKSVRVVLNLIANAKSNVEDAPENHADPDTMIIGHAQVNRAAKQRRRTYRAHGRINAYMASPAHVEIILVPAQEITPKAKGASAPKDNARLEQGESMD